MEWRPRYRGRRNTPERSVSSFLPLRRGPTPAAYHASHSLGALTRTIGPLDRSAGGPVLYAFHERLRAARVADHHEQGVVARDRAGDLVQRRAVDRDAEDASLPGLGPQHDQLANPLDLP